MDSNNYWKRRAQLGTSRRRVLAGGGIAVSGLTAMGLVGCGGGDDDDTEPTAGPGGSGSPAVSPTVAAEKPVAGGIYKTIGGPVGGSLDIHRTNTPVEYGFIWPAVANYLIRFAIKDGLSEADLAASLPEIPGDGTELIFKIRPDAKFQQKAPANGRAVTAEDVKATFERIKSPDTVSPRAGNYGNVESITVVDATTVKFKLKSPQADLLNFMSDQYDFIIPKEIAARGKEAIKTMEDVVGSGAYELTAYEAGKGLTMKKRADGYWKKDTAWLDGFEYIHQTDTQQQANALKVGQVIAAGLPVDLVKQFDGDPKYKIVQAASPNREMLLINHTRDRYKDPRVRMALWRAIDRKQVYQNVFGGAGIPGGPMSPAAVSWVLPEAELKKMPGFGDRATEISEAKKLLAAAGLPNGFEETITTVTAFSADLLNDVLVGNLRDIGVTLKTENIGTDFSVFLAREVAGDYNLASTLFNSGPYPDAQLVLYHHTDPTKGSRNYGKAGSPELDAKLNKQATLYDFAERQKLVFEIQRDIINNPGPGWVGSRIGFSVAQSNLQNFIATPYSTSYRLSETYWIKA